MKIAILGATSQIAKDLIASFARQTNYECTLFSRNPDVVIEWLKKVNIRQPYQTLDYSNFDVKNHYDVIINFVGVGDPAQAKQMGRKIFDVTYKFDMMVLEYLQQHSETKYIFLSSGAVYGGDFAQPVTGESVAIIPVNHLNSSNGYAVAKLYAEVRHRALPELSIIDIRVFNYFSHTQNLDARFFITDMVRAVKNKNIFLTMPGNIVRDFLIPEDFFNLIEVILKQKFINNAVDCYTKSTIDKHSLLSEMKTKYSLEYEMYSGTNVINSTGSKKNYFSKNKVAGDLGYIPKNTSLSGLMKEISLIGL